ncbi:hypothetical protein Deipr_2057 (plasmid) [Deinococcus proteolyticus MRP]|uniref:Oligosaccharide repeat unit polymerase n=1 Tax=Deinococcus proteolyticus (strain ATCC 35074 / DSM 20540 / JCM 6276 / NBRC 101906 / NCIMB 13154 / VKM Ac-1939 / CCM 2703 / MRP) TaxID=693977 RepID=F0RPY6_DEIPM|nr:hypothetical protein [Deinococcus proteolyticus]ADY27188.1 hypothetical protein Deipr_2057 [Deinococcus proteolyticus MRP]
MTQLRRTPVRLPSDSAGSPRLPSRAADTAGQRNLGKLYLPYLVFALFNVGTYLAFLYGPFAWPIRNAGLMSGLLTAFFVFYTAGYVFGAQRQVGRPGREVTDWVVRHLGVLLLVGVLVFAASIYVYTGEFFWNTARIFGDQQENYYDTLRYGETSSSLLNAPFVLLKIVLQPLITLGLIYATMNFRRLKPWEKGALLAVYLFWVLFSVFRGTDKEIFDIAVIFLTATAVNYYRSLTGRVSLAQLARSLLFVTLAVVTLVGFLSVFSQRKLTRTGGQTNICVIEAGVCARGTDTPLGYVYGLTVAYATHGYYGMSLALQEPFNTTFPFGNAPALKPLSDAVMGEEYLEHSYPNKIDRRGWDNGVRWSTAYTSWASDISFWLVPFVMFLVGLVTALSWKDAVLNESLLATAVFSFMTTMSLFLSANNQVGIALDSLSAFIVITLVWLVTRTYRLRLRGH